MTIYVLEKPYYEGPSDLDFYTTENGALLGAYLKYGISALRFIPNNHGDGIVAYGERRHDPPDLYIWPAEVQE